MILNTFYSIIVIFLFVIYSPSFSSSAHQPAPHRVLFVLGGPGSGKGTLCSQLSKQLGWTHISAGSLLRTFVQDSRKSESITGVKTMRSDEDDVVNEVKRVIKAGGLVNSRLMMKLIKEELNRHRNRLQLQKSSDDDVIKTRNKKHFFLLDGFPRNWENHIMWEKEMMPGIPYRNDGTAISNQYDTAGCIFLDCSEEVMIERCLARAELSDMDVDNGDEKRFDDQIDIIKQRLVTFQQNMGRVVEHFSAKEGKTKIFRINADLPKEQVLSNVKAELQKLDDAIFR